MHRFYRRYPAAGVKNLGNPKGHFEQLGVYCGMAFDKKEAASTSLCSINDDDGLFVWSERTIGELKKRNGTLQKLQLDAVAYLWEICYDMLIATEHNVSESPGYEGLGLRKNTHARR